MEVVCWVVLWHTGKSDREGSWKEGGSRSRGSGIHTHIHIYAAYCVWSSIFWVSNRKYVISHSKSHLSIRYIKYVTLHSKPHEFRCVRVWSVIFETQISIDDLGLEVSFATFHRRETYEFKSGAWDWITLYLECRVRCCTSQRHRNTSVPAPSCTYTPTHTQTLYVYTEVKKKTRKNDDEDATKAALDSPAGRKQMENTWLCFDYFLRVAAENKREIRYFTWKMYFYQKNVW